MLTDNGLLAVRILYQLNSVWRQSMNQDLDYELMLFTIAINEASTLQKTSHRESSLPIPSSNILIY